MARTVQTTHTVDQSMMKNFLCGAGSLQGTGNSWPQFLTERTLPNGTISGGTIFGTFSLSSDVTPSTTLVLAWTGTATNATGAILLVRGPPGFTVTSDPGGVVVGSTGSNLSVAGTNGYIEFNFTTSVPTGSQNFTYANNSTFSGMTQIIICKKTDYNAIINAVTPRDLINDAYVTAWSTLGPKVLRLGGSFGINDNCNITQRQYLPDWQRAIFWRSGLWNPRLWAGVASGTNAYTIAGATNTPAAYTHGEVLQCGFTNASNSTPITINVAARGVVPLFDQFGIALTSGGISNGSPKTLIYDDLLGGYLVFSGLGYGNGLGSYPIEILAAFCNTVGADLWINLPTHITTANSVMEPTNSVSQIVSYFSSVLTQNLYVEYSNEIWNFAGNIGINTNFAVNCGIALGFTSDNNRRFHGFYGYKVRTIAPIVQAAWTNPTYRVKMVMAFAGQGVSGLNGDINKYRLQGTDLASVANGGQGNATWISYTSNANYTTVNNRPVDVCDTLAYATYYSGGQCQNFDQSYVTGKGPLKTITGISSDATGGVITYSADPGYSTGVRVVLASITQTGSPTLSGMNVSLTKLTATTYKMFTDATLATPVDTSAFTYTSGGTSQSYRPVSGLTSWADLYATGTAANITSALQSLNADILGTGNDQTTSELNTVVYPAWEIVAASYDGARPTGKSNLTIELYEGALESISPSTATCTTLGIVTSYNATIGNLLTGYKNSKYFYNRALTTINQFQAASPGRVTLPVWFLAWPGVNNQWSMVTGSDVYTSGHYQSYDVVKNLNNAKRRLFWVG